MTKSTLRTLAIFGVQGESSLGLQLAVFLLHGIAGREGKQALVPFMSVFILFLSFHPYKTAIQSGSLNTPIEGQGSNIQIWRQRVEGETR